MAHEHHYKITTRWTGNQPDGNRNIRKYDRSHVAEIDGKPQQQLTTDNAAVGDKSKLNPEDLLVTALSSCHMLSYLYACALKGIVILDYIDHAAGTMTETSDGGGHFTEVILRPECTVAEESMIDAAIEMHHRAHEICYIANSVNFPVRCEPACKIA